MRILPIIRLLMIRLGRNFGAQALADNFATIQNSAIVLLLSVFLAVQVEPEQEVIDGASGDLRSSSRSLGMTIAGAAAGPSAVGSLRALLTTFLP